MSKLRVYLCRHGETEWTLSGQHTSYSDIPITPNGELQAQKLKQRLENVDFTKVYVSPLLRAKMTCEIVGFMQDAEITDDLFEWNYGEVEGKTTPEIRKTIPGWTIFNDGAPGGESIQQVSDRADRMIEIARQYEGNVALFSSGHFSRVLAARWCGLSASDGRSLALSTASLSILGYERDVPVIQLWNDTDFL
ncbi:MAG: Adenosylcobalamin/alpha-ribazole phosphatase [Chlamydiae bacterium]|nr:Adenosylcobalamin/alpha-ribazole phosphatase [Chlamydiota bacterium]